MKKRSRRRGRRKDLEFKRLLRARVSLTNDDLSNRRLAKSRTRREARDYRNTDVLPFLLVSHRRRLFVVGFWTTVVAASRRGGVLLEEEEKITNTDDARKEDLSRRGEKEGQ